jgi:hypothetical protein
MYTTPNAPAELDEPPHAPTAPPAVKITEPRGCLYALSQPPLMVFLTVIATLLAITGAHDLLAL